ncbi:MAG: hypothetical protein EPO18_16790 [Methylobacter sp.]|nr:MAG: hypothetical protein EPO18_16790 [Methylobacter sp.]
MVLHLTAYRCLYCQLRGHLRRSATRPVIIRTINLFRRKAMRSILLYLLGIPIPIIILLALFWH